MTRRSSGLPSAGNVAGASEVDVMDYVDFVEPRRECATRDPTTHRMCGAHVLRRPDNSWWCAICGERRTMADTVEASLLPSMKGQVEW